MKDYFDGRALRKEFFVKSKSYPEKLAIAEYETGFALTLEDQPTIFISKAFGIFLGDHLRDVERLFTWKEAREIIEEFTLDSAEIKDDLYTIARKRAQEKIREENR